MAVEKAAAAPSTGELLEAVSNMVVKVFADHTGRGPTKARAYADRDIIVCVMEDTMTKAERTLIDSGRVAAVKQVRDALEETMREDLAIGIEALTGRRVLAQNGTGSFEPDVQSELFILESQAASHGHLRSRAGGRNRPRVV